MPPIVLVVFYFKMKNEFLNKIENVLKGEDSLKDVKYLYEFIPDSALAIFPDIVYKELNEKDLCITPEDRIWRNTRRLTVIKNKYYKREPLQLKEWDDSIAYIDIARVLYINCCPDHAKAIKIAAKEIIRLFKNCQYKGHKITADDILNEAEQIVNKVLEDESRDKKEYLEALTPDTKSNRACKWKYSKEVLDKAEEVFGEDTKYAMERNELPKKLDGIILRALIEYVWNQEDAATNEDVLKLLQEQFKITITTGTLYKWRRENCPEEHKEHKQHEKSEKQQQKELNKLINASTIILDAYERYGDKWKSFVKASVKHVYYDNKENKEDIDYLIDLYDDIRTIKKVPYESLTKEHLDYIEQMKEIFEWLNKPKNMELSLYQSLPLFYFKYD